LQASNEQPMNDRDAELRERAYYIWEADGRPDGRAHLHWQMAEIAAAVLRYMEVPFDRRGSARGEAPLPSSNPSTAATPWSEQRLAHKSKRQIR
jgi:Protein of unknown function (DUF2934)